ncbi:unnamed protein product [Camellia sinensis]|uniref:Uncharacterized protein n=2 Tax=Camellia TaxID=4441 RepID=A0A7J7FUS7_CAMSI|nr:hypothetical protein HYC85_031659 [Camellia sinensis]KAI7984413.1 hypothetical protein LOK49_LG15G01200 [Camellia lanceoleosa]
MTWVAKGFQISPAMAPSYNQQQEEDGQLQILRDKHYAMQGKFMAFTVIAVFSLFLVSLIFVPYLRRRRALTAKLESSDAKETDHYSPERPSGLKDDHQLRRSYY